MKRSGGARRSIHARDGFDVIQDHVHLSNNRLFRARMNTTKGAPQVEPGAGHENGDDGDDNQSGETPTVNVLGAYLSTKAQDSYPSAPEIQTRVGGPRHTSRVVYGLAVKLTNVTKLRQNKRRSGVKINRSTSNRTDKSSKKDSKSTRDVQTAVMLHHQKHNNPLEMSEKVLAAFRAVAHIWLQRKARRDQVLKDNVTSNLVMGTTTKSMAMSGNVFDIISKNFVTPVPALQFFDDGSGDAPLRPTSAAASKRFVLPSSAPAHRQPAGAPSRPTSTQPPHGQLAPHDTPVRPNARRPTTTTPRGICYTVNDEGTRLCKTEHNMGDLELDRSARGGKEHDKAMTVEDALLQSMNKRLKLRMGLKKSRIVDISNKFNARQRDLKQKLVATLAMHWAEQEDMHTKKLSVSCLNDTNVPSFRIDKDVNLSRLRHEKWRLLQMCKLVSLFGAMLRTMEETPGEMTRPEMRLLYLFRILLEANSVLTPIVLQSIMSQVTPADMQCSRVEAIIDVVYKRLTCWQDQPSDEATNLASIM
ncbi:Aste57867_14503 [Aphanomyces stellatus]|uniref:Aste57867_14503 protein n=1 Tax=Aphanomyces stellatus TaxID=120398 RepID=A0A485L1X1_9STRA|nr:hypothetical protein As57867_014449 [Aphanomyces stellatus]VFT91325.1 Aste57867_14503 [Aphanomyces stellatus]